MSLPSLVEALTRPHQRSAAANRLAETLGVQELVILLRDSELDAFVPAFGFAQTLPEGAGWQSFAAECAASGIAEGQLPRPSTKARVPALGVATSDGVVILLGGTVKRDVLEAVESLLPLLVTALRGEQAIQTAQAYLSQARMAEGKGALLAQSLDSARRELETIEQVAQVLSSELDLERLAQRLTDACTEIAGAEFGAFFFNVQNHKGEEYALYTLSGVAREAFASFPMPRNTELFGATFRGEGVIRLDDVTQDARFGKSPPYYGLPPGHLPVCSYMALPVLANDGFVLGGLFFGHSKPGRFTAQAERVLASLSRWASIALQNAKLYEQSTLARTQLELANRAKDEFLGIVSHELRTPVTTIFGSLRILTQRHDSLDKDSIRDLIDGAEQESQKLVRLVENLLLLARLEVGQHPPMTVVQVDRLVKGVVDQAHRDTPAREIRYRIRSEADIALSCVPVYVEQMLLNLITNAIKYSPTEMPIEVEVHSTPSGIAFAVLDRGPGVDPAELPLLFESFYRSPSVVRERPGKGLGLSVCRRLAEIQGGNVSAELRNGGGLEVTFTLPVRAVTDDVADGVEGESLRSKPASA